MDDKERHLTEARRRLTELQTTLVCDTLDDVTRNEGYLREALAKAGVTAEALGAGVTAQTIGEAVKATCLRSARHRLHELETTTIPHGASTADHYVHSIRKLLAVAGLDLAALDPEGKSGEAEIEERFRAGKRRICLQKARHDFDEFETSSCAGWGTLTEGIVEGIVRNVERAGEGLAVLDPEGKSSAADIRLRLDKAELRLKLMYVQAQLKEAESTTSCFSLYSVFRYREDMMKMLQSLQAVMPGVGMEAADATGKATAAEVAERLTRAEKRLCESGALQLVNELEKLMNGAAIPHAGQYRRMLREIDDFTAHTEGKIGLTLPGTAAEKRIADILTAACARAAAEELQDFEKMGAPKSLKEIEERAERIVSLFNRASLPNAAGVTLQDAPTATVQERMDEAGIRARDLYYAAGGKLPVMKRIRLSMPQAQGS